MQNPKPQQAQAAGPSTPAVGPRGISAARVRNTGCMRLRGGCEHRLPLGHAC